MLKKAIESMNKSLHHLDIEFSKIQMWRANPLLVEDIMVEQYWSLQSLKNMASVTIMDPQTLQIKPWDKTSINDIAKAITQSAQGLNPQSMADSILIKIPLVTEERRKEMTKVVKTLSEDAKISIRNIRWDSVKLFKKSEDDKKISEDEHKDLLETLQKEVNTINKIIDEKTKKKNEDVMKV